MSDPFTVLGLPPTATAEEIKARYRRLARRHHPDSGPTGSSARMAELNSAYDELTRDLEGCRRRALAHQPSPQRRRQPRRTPQPPRSRTRAAQWRDWLDKGRRAAAGGDKAGHPSRSHTATPIRVAPSILTICRQHGSAELRVKGREARLSTVLFSPRYFDVARGPFSSDDQVFRVRLTGQLPTQEDSASLRVRSGGTERRVPIYEFSCPTAEGSCAFAS